MEWVVNLSRLRICVWEWRRYRIQFTLLSSPTSAPTLLEPSQEQPGSGSTASAPVSDVSAPACTNEVWPPLRPVSVAQNKPSTVLSITSNPSTPWFAWPDDSGRWDSWMAAQHLPRDLVQPSSGLNNSLKRRRTLRFCWAICLLTSFWQQCWGWSSLVLMKLLETRFHKSLRFCWTCHWKRHERFRSCLYKWGMTSSAVVSVAQKNKPSTMLSSNVQSIDLFMNCTAWRFWTMRQLNGCSKPAPRCSAAKQ